MFGIAFDLADWDENRTTLMDVVLWFFWGPTCPNGHLGGYSLYRFGITQFITLITQSWKLPSVEYLHGNLSGHRLSLERT